MQEHKHLLEKLVEQLHAGWQKGASGPVTTARSVPALKPRRENDSVIASAAPNW